MGSEDAAAEHGKIDGHRLTEFIYGTITALVVIAGLTESSELGWWSAFTTIVVGAAALWVAHAYSSIISRRLTLGRRLDARELWEAMRTSWPIVSSGLIVAAPLLLTGIGLTTVGAALSLSNALGIAILAVVGYVAGVVSKEPFARRLVLAVGSAAIGVAVVAIEFGAHH